MEIKKILGYYWPHIKEYKITYILLLVFYAIATVMNNVIGPIVYKRIIDITASGVVTPEVVQNLTYALYVLAGFIVAHTVSYRIADYMMVYSDSKVLKRLADVTFEKLQRHAQKFFADSFGGALVAKSKRFVDSFDTLQDIFIFNIWMNGLTMIGILASLAWFAPLIAVLFMAWLILFVLVAIYFVKRKIKKDLAKANAQSNTTGVLADIVTNVMNLKMFASSNREIDQFKKVTNLEEEKRYDAWRFMMHQFVAQGTLIATFEIIGMVVAVKLWVAGSITSGTILLIQVYLFSLFERVWNLGRNMTNAMSAIADAQEMVDIFETPIDVQDIAKPEKCKIKEGAIEIKDISFSYHPAPGGAGQVHEGIFNNFSLSVKSGEKIGLVGHSGSGKTTITKLLLRFMDVDGGEIRIDGQNIAKISQDDLRRNISYVPQDPILFHRSLRENIAYGKSDATQDEIVAAAKAANAHDFITELPEGYDTLVGERGIKLSGGERQRVAIARAMLKDAPILILDEATSALDSISERHIQEAFSRLMQGRTTLAIAHRLSTIQKMDRIVVFSKGTIVEQGTHAELTKNTGVYAELWKEQSSGFIN